MPLPEFIETRAHAILPIAVGIVLFPWESEYMHSLLFFFAD